MYRAKFIIALSIFMVTIVFSVSSISSQSAEDFMIVDEAGEAVEIQPDSYADDGKPVYKWNNVEYQSTLTEYYPRGRIVYYGSNSEICTSGILIPGTALLPKGLLAVAYAFGLIYLFLGISIISDLFMDGIEVITSQTVTLDIKDQNGDVVA